MIEAVLFDLGDTLFHFTKPTAAEMVTLAMRPLYDRLEQLGHHLPAFNKYVRVMKRRFLLKLVWSRIRRREMRIIEALRKAHHAMGVEMEPGPWRAVCHEYMTQPLRKFFVMADHVDEMLRHLHGRGYKLGIVSNTVLPGIDIDDVLRDSGIIDYFTARIYSSEVGFRKPDPRIFRVALDALEVAPDQALFIGDHVVNDVKAPARMGIRTVLALHGDRIPRTPVRPDHIIRGLAELPAILDAYQ